MFYFLGENVWCYSWHGCRLRRRSIDKLVLGGLLFDAYLGCWPCYVGFRGINFSLD
ncbi:hypothetical protein [Marinimicrobium sp. ABcell2]|uniref:hypothetical protein n=1 Tax=Marinimicrobium sp. ABcell2 TaxID=3069751 RepID=UPI0027B54F08|nr:hypothetical protein [Marinimicrobium sp. ABcell2]MDQ2078046.1 hypothetical protein [Marinimicrobium sp. ABcell2]